MFLTLLLVYVTGIRVVKSDLNTGPSIAHQIVGKRLSNVRWPQIEAIIGFQMCLRKCEAMSSCFSINYNRPKLQCELNVQTKSEAHPLVDDETNVYAEIKRSDLQRNLCGNEICNIYSTCFSMKSNKKICIETECSESIQAAHRIVHGNLVQFSRFPAKASYKCNPYYHAIGTTNVIQCPIGGKWEAPNIRCSHDDMRLGKSDLSNDGLVYVYRSGIWGTVCDDEFKIDEANVVCRSLGFSGALAVFEPSSLGAGGDILMDDVDCAGYEETIFDCNYTAKHNCVELEAVGIACK